ncbi:MAG: hypothetical protein H6721_28815 [Sandaracinus sp.]|nr:hypothetical protein [Sandaracinus sp.]MCB9622748.1 hypothetical protein [Sandaracinus sp.]MCB9636132.1 hypothetical protein [Sandaracinus sp.]
MRATSVAAFALLVSCAEPNAVLDVRMRLPAVEGRTVAHVQVGTGADSFDDLWGTDPIVFDLDVTESDTCNVSFSVEAPTARSDRAALGELRLKIWFCSADAPTCSEDSGAPIWRIRLERPLYPGERTEWVLGDEACAPLTEGSRLPETVDPAYLLEVDRCQIRGCVDGDAAAGRDFCLEADRTQHPCD